MLCQARDNPADAGAFKLCVLQDVNADRQLVPFCWLVASSRASVRRSGLNVRIGGRLVICPAAFWSEKRAEAR